MSLLVTEITAMAPLMPACRSVFSSQESPITTGSRWLRANATPRAFWSWSIRTAWNPRSYSPPRTRTPTSPPPTTITCPSPGLGSPRILPVSRAPTMSAVTTGSSAIPSAVSSTWATFSAPWSPGDVSADPVRSMIPR